jgi:threonine/homoserine/homoserine lactone efflux protein
MSLDTYLAYLVACVLIIVVPGPTVTLVVANSLARGTRAGLLNVAGTQLGVAGMIALVAIGLTSLVETMGWWFDLLRLAGAAYLVWMGIGMLRARGDAFEARAARPPRGGYFLQGFLVAVTNPKTLVFFGAFIPQFLDPARDHVIQVLIMGATAVAVATLSDSTYAIATGRAGRSLSAARARLMARASGVCLIFGGAWLAASRTR